MRGRVGETAGALRNWSLGIGLFAAIVVFMVILFRSQGWLGDKPAEPRGAAAPKSPALGEPTPGARSNGTWGSPPERPG
jgi:hypothetical protein